MTIRNTRAVSIEPVILTDESTVVAQYEPAERDRTTYQSEAALEASFIKQLQDQAYEYASSITTEEDLTANLRAQLEALNHYRFSDAEWKRFFEASIAASNDSVVDKTRRIQEDHVQILQRDNGESKNIRLIDKKRIHNNRLQVINQYAVDTGSHKNRYDVTILVNGLPLVHIELKRRGVPIREAFNQINRYQRDSFWAGSGLYGYVQVFVISNGTDTKYYSNTTRLDHVTENTDGRRQAKAANSDSFEFTSWWSDAANQPITELEDFTKTFFSKHTLLAILTRYCVFTTAKKLLVMRPYQIAATEQILQRIHTATLNGLTGSAAAGGYIWHTTGSGKTLTSFKTAKLAAGLDGVDKVLFVVDRKDLDHQTIKEYNRFSAGTVSANQSTAQLAAQINDPEQTIIVTTIQKLSKFVGGHCKHAIYNGHVVLIFDECHRSQFGDMHTAITKAFRNYHLFGFTGTPIFAENAGTSGKFNLRTTAQAFGDQLHTYTIVDAIRDKNVLPFRIDYIDTIKMPGHIADGEVPGIDTEQALLAKERIEQVVHYIREHFAQKTRRNSTYSLRDARVRGFNSLLATASIRAAREYYSEFKRQQEHLPADQRLTVGIIYSYAPNADAPDGLLGEESVDPTRLTQDDKDFLDAAITDYNRIFATNYRADAQGFENYYEDISERLTNKTIDLVIVVNMFLTGFDSKTLNTLWVDKPLRAHGLIQAFSRTNRILNSVKTYGNIVCFRDLQEQTDEAIALFGNKDAGGLVLLRPYTEYLQEYLEKVSELRTDFTLGEVIASESEQKRFIQLFGAILRLRNILTSFDEFAGADVLEVGEFDDYKSLYVDLYQELRRTSTAEKEVINDDLVFEIELVKQVEVNVDYVLMLVEKHRNEDDRGDREIPVDISRALAASPSLHNKRDLIEDFVRSVSSTGAIDAQWEAYIQNRQQDELDALITEERLKPEETKKLMSNALSGLARIGVEGTTIQRLLPPLSRFHRTGADDLNTKKHRVADKLAGHADRFSGLIKTTPT